MHARTCSFNLAVSTKLGAPDATFASCVQATCVHAYIRAPARERVSKRAYLVFTLPLHITHCHLVEALITLGIKLCLTMLTPYIYAP